MHGDMDDLSGRMLLRRRRYRQRTVTVAGLATTGVAFGVALVASFLWL